MFLLLLLTFFPNQRVNLWPAFAAIVPLERVTAAPFIFYGRAREPVPHAQSETTIG